MRAGADDGRAGAEPRAAVERAIRDHGPITFAEYMEHALYGPGGYYHGAPVGPDADFVTSPHVHQVFGTLLGAAIRELHDLLDRPSPLRITEVGAGDGTLARQLLAALGDLPLSFRAVEVGIAARRSLGSLDGVLVADELRPPADVVLAHELLDNLPFRIVRGEREVRIGIDRAGDLVEILAPLEDGLPPAAGPDEERIVPVGAFAFVDRVAETLDRGYALLIDYGSMEGAGGPAHGYRGHRVVEDLLDDPGATDLTAGVDLAVVSERARERGLEAHGPVTQHDALRSLGFEGWHRAELDRQHRQLDERRGLDAVRTWSGRSRATLLVDPSALGRLRWLLLGTPGLPAPSWTSATGR